MKNISKFIKVRFVIGGIFIIMGSMFLCSCLDDNTEELQNEHDRKMADMKTRYGFTEADTIGTTGIYFKYTSDTLEWTEIIPTYKDFVFVSVLGKYSDGSVFDLTDSADAVQYNLDDIVMVYGPAKLQLNRTFAGFQRALTQMHERSEAIILLPHEQAFYNYEPIVYWVNLHRVIRENSIDEYEKQQIDSVRLLLGIADNDTIPNLVNVYSIITQAGTTIPDIVSGDSVKIKIYGYYAEADPYYMDTTQSFLPGRQFYRIGTGKEIVTYLYGEEYFPVSQVVDSVVSRMKIGEIREVVSSSEYGYGAEGFWNPYANIAIIPPYTPLHYRIELIDVIKD